MRDQWRPDSAYTTNVTGILSFVESGTTTVTMQNAVAAGELVLVHESGAFTRADPTWPWTALNNNVGGTLAILTAVTVPNITISSQTVSTAVGHPTRLVGGYHVIPMQTGSALGFSIRSSSGLQVTGFIQVAAETSNCILYTEALQNGNFVLYWVNTSNIAKFAIYTPQGVQVTGPTVVATALYIGSSVPWIGKCVLGNGNFVVTYSLAAGGVFSQIYGPTGATVGSVITLDATLNGHFHATQPCANGDFLHVCHDVTHSLHKIWRVTNAGVIVWGPYNMAGAYTGLFASPDQARMHPQQNRLVELVGGTIAWLLPNTSQYANAFILSSSGTLIKQLDFGTTYHDVGVASPIVLTPNGFALAHGQKLQPNTYASFYDVNGNVLVENQIVDTSGPVVPNGATATLHFYLAFAGSGITISRYHIINGNIEVRMIHTDHRGGLLGPPVIHQPPTPNDVCAIVGAAGVDGMVFLCWYASGTTLLTVTTYKIGRSSVFGVAASGVAAGGSTVVNANGVFTLPSTQIFGPGVAFDQRSQPVMGCRGIVGGQNAILFGWGT